MRPLFWMSPTLMRGSEKCRLNVLLFSDLNFAKVLIDRLNMLMFLSVQGIRKIWYSYANQRHSRGSCHSYLITCKSVIPAYFKFVMKYCVSNADKKKITSPFRERDYKAASLEMSLRTPLKVTFPGGRDRTPDSRKQQNSSLPFPPPHIHTHAHTHTPQSQTKLTVPFILLSRKIHYERWRLIKPHWKFAPF